MGEHRDIYGNLLDYPDYDRCVKCRKWREKMDAKYGKKGNAMGTLADTLKTEAMKSLVNQMRTELNKNLSGAMDERRKAQEALESANNRVKAATEALAVFDQTFAAKVDYKYYHLDSRTNATAKAGHYIRRNGDEYECTCEAGKHGRECWAVGAIRACVKRGDANSWMIDEAKYNNKYRGTIPFARGARIPHGYGGW